MSARIRFILLSMVILLPVGALVIDAVAYILQGNDVLRLIVPTQRRFILFSRTILYGGAVALAAISIGIMAGSLLYTKQPQWLRRAIWVLFGLSITLLLVPAYVHALAWSSLLSAWQIRPEGLLISVWVMTMTLLPLALGLSLLGFRSVEPVLLDAARVVAGDLRVFTSVAIPLAWPFPAAAGILAFLLTILDYSVPSLFFVNIYSLEIFAEFSASNQPGAAFLLSLPLMLVTLLFIYGGLSLLPSLSAGKIGPTKDNTLSFCFPVWFRGLQYLALGLIALQVFVPLVRLIQETGSLDRFFLALDRAGGEITYTLFLATTTAILTTCMALAAAWGLSQAVDRFHYWFIFTLPMAIPAPLIGIAMISLFTKLPGQLFYGTALLPILAGLVRFLPIAILLLVMQLKRYNQHARDAAKLYQKSPFHGLLRIHLPLMMPGIVAAFVAAFILTIGELGATLIVVPPGSATVTMRIYNFMHYGASDMIAGLCLAMLILSFIGGGTTGLFFFLKNRRKHDGS